MLGIQGQNNTTTYRVILIAPSDNCSPINLEDLCAWARPLNESRHKSQSLWIGSAMLRTKMPSLNPPPLNTSLLDGLEIIASQKDVRHVRIFFVPNLAAHGFLQIFLSHLHCPTSLTTNNGCMK
jgi:hypothetical protein